MIPHTRTGFTKMMCHEDLLFLNWGELRLPSRPFLHQPWDSLNGQAEGTWWPERAMGLREPTVRAVWPVSGVGTEGCPALGSTEQDPCGWKAGKQLYPFCTPHLAPETSKTVPCLFWKELLDWGWTFQPHVPHWSQTVLNSRGTNGLPGTPSEEGEATHGLGFTTKERVKDGGFISKPWETAARGSMSLSPSKCPFCLPHGLLRWPDRNGDEGDLTGKTPPSVLAPLSSAMERLGPRGTLSREPSWEVPLCLPPSSPEGKDSNASEILGVEDRALRSQEGGSASEVGQS